MNAYARGRSSRSYSGGLDGLACLVASCRADGSVPASVVRLDSGLGAGAGSTAPRDTAVQGDLFFGAPGSEAAEAAAAAYGASAIDPLVARGIRLELARAGAWGDFALAWLHEPAVDAVLVAWALECLELGFAARGSPAADASLRAAGRVAKEIERLIGLLRFRPDGEGRYVARFRSDHAVVAALAPRFSARFGSRPWAVVDEGRGLVLSRDPPAPARLGLLIEGAFPGGAAAGEGPDGWTDLWRTYHRSVAIESRANPRAQLSRMPRRYWQFLCEMYDVDPGPGGSP